MAAKFQWRFPARGFRSEIPPLTVYLAASGRMCFLHPLRNTFYLQHSEPLFECEEFSSAGFLAALLCMNTAIIVAAGKGTRMGANVDKLWLEVAGRPVVAHTWQKFNDAAEIDEIILVVRDGMQPHFTTLARQFNLHKKFQLIPGGAERQDSVWNGLAAVNPATKIVLIQDAARPCTAAELITATIRAARETGAAVAAQPVTDTLKETADGQLISRTVDRSKIWSVQTPQTFQLSVIRRAIILAREKNLMLTDDTAACELIGQPVRLVKSMAPNPKVTVPADLPFVASLLG